MFRSRRGTVISLVAIICLGGIIFGNYEYRHALADFGWLPFHVASSSSPAVGSIAPDFELESLTGEKIKLVNLRGTPVIINFWATWCAPCVLEMPGLQRTYENYQGKFEILAVNAGENSFRVHQFAKDIGITFNVLFDPDSSVQALYQITGYPTTFILDSDGIIRVKHIGQLDEDRLSSYLIQLGIIQ
jgi:peroxiredoxin